ncbi:hypothetical protein [uncultured Sphingomonas sp.]|uniref:hypothetical protein n=1 Tax=uncultured Sphingomonas sp. TaxID=158754 RepID=UPI0035C97CB8
MIGGAGSLLATIPFSVLTLAYAGSYDRFYSYAMIGTAVSLPVASIGTFILGKRAFSGDKYYSLSTQRILTLCGAWLCIPFAALVWTWVAWSAGQSVERGHFRPPASTKLERLPV